MIFGLAMRPGFRLSKAPERFRARKVFLVLYKGKLSTKQLCNHELRYFTIACENFSGPSRNGPHCLKLTAQKISG